MSQLRVNFLNWKPDFDDFPNDGLAEARNLVHEPEGYKPVYLMDTLDNSGSTLLSIVGKTAGPNLDLFTAEVFEATGELRIALNGNAVIAATTGYPLSFAATLSSADVTYFDVCEVEDRYFFVVEAQGIQQSNGSLTSLRFSAYASINS